MKVKPSEREGNKTNGALILEIHEIALELIKKIEEMLENDGWNMEKYNSKFVKKQEKINLFNETKFIGKNSDERKIKKDEKKANQTFITKSEILNETNSDNNKNATIIETTDKRFDKFDSATMDEKRNEISQNFHFIETNETINLFKNNNNSENQKNIAYGVVLQKIPLISKMETLKTLKNRDEKISELFSELKKFLNQAKGSDELRALLDNNKNSKKSLFERLKDEIQRRNNRRNEWETTTNNEKIITEFIHDDYSFMKELDEEITNELIKSLNEIKKKKNDKVIKKCDNNLKKTKDLPMKEILLSELSENITKEAIRTNNFNNNSKNSNFSRRLESTEKLPKSIKLEEIVKNSFKIPADIIQKEQNYYFADRLQSAMVNLNNLINIANDEIIKVLNKSGK